MHDHRSLDELFADALERDEGPQRDAWIEEACRDDPALERELRGLLSAHNAASRLDDVTFGPPSHEEAAPPEQVGSYRVEGEIGRGGMGIVYRATDTQLDRTVALKALPSYVEGVSRLRARLEREAKALAALNHRNVASIYGIAQQDGRAYLVLEYVEGVTLEERLRKGRLRTEEARSICAQIAAGVAAAHDAGVIHRDLKPSNVKITPGGDVKVLDFGLAKVRSDAARGVDEQAGVEEVDDSSAVQTLDGAVIGTPAYMSPEQARGEELDRRTDCWSFGVVLHECLTGISYFRTKSSDESIRAVLTKPITLDALPASTPPVVRHLLRHCLERDRNKRVRDLHDVCLALQDDAPLAEPAPLASTRSRLVLGALMIPLLVVVAWVAFLVGTRGTGGSDVTRERSIAHVFAPASFHIPRLPSIDITADGRRIAYVGTDRMPEAPPAIYLRDLDDIEARRIPGTEDAHELAFSDDGSRIAYFTRSSVSKRYELRVLDVATGVSSVAIIDPTGEHIHSMRPPAWLSPTDLAILSADGMTIYRVSAERRARLDDSLEFETWARLGEEETWSGAWSLESVRGREAFLVTRATLGRESLSLSTFFVDSEGVKPVLDNAGYAAATSDGYMLFVRAGKLHAIAFDPDSGSSTGNVTALSHEPTKSGAFACSDNGTLVMSRDFGRATDRRLMTIDRPGNQSLLRPERMAYVAPLSASPDGRELAILYRDGSTDRLRIDSYDLETKRSRPVASPDGLHMTNPVWLPDGRLLLRTQGERMFARLFAVDVESGAADLLFDGIEELASAASPQVTADGRFAIVQYSTVRGDSEPGVYALPLDGTSGPRPVVLGSPRAGVPALSPDNRWLAYHRAGSTFVQPFDLERDRSDEAQVLENASFAFWSADSSELFFHSRGSGDVMGVRILDESPVRLSTPVRIVDARRAEAFMPFRVARFTAHPDGRFLYVAEPAGGPDPHLHIVLNFDAAFRE